MEHRNGCSNSSKQPAFLIAFSVLLLVGLLAWSAPRTRADSQARTYLPAIMQHLTTYTEVPTSNATTTATVTLTSSATATTTAPVATMTASATPTMTPTMTPSATATSTATATATPSATPSATATASATPSMTPTGTPMVSCSSRYPITLNLRLFDNDSFMPPSDPDELQHFLLYSDATYTNKTQRRIYLAAADSAGFARWRADTPPDSVPALVASLSGTGNIAQGFDEAPWPVGTPGDPSAYPIRPTSLGANDGDWIYGSTANMSSDVLTALEAHVINKTLMTFPIYDQISQAGSNLNYHVVLLGDFLLRSYGTEPRKGRYLDLVYIGSSTTPQCE